LQLFGLSGVYGVEMKIMKRFFALLFLLTASSLLAKPTFETITVDGLERRYLVSAPAQKSAEPRPLLLMFHGGGGTALGLSRQGFSRLVRERGFIVVYPEGIEKHWYDPRFEGITTSSGEVPDDLKFVDELLDQLCQDYDVDSKRIYAAGISNGAIMSHLVGSKLSKRFAAIAPIVGGIGDVQMKDFAPQDPVSVLILQGTEDPLVPYDGGQITVFQKERGAIVSTQETVEAWAGHNGCAQGQSEMLPDTTDDQCTVERTIYPNGRQGSEVILYKIIGGGHTVPGGSQYLPKRLIGTVCRDIDAIQIMGEFFVRHHK
jgi:polyhydroxybutyrate depolymerase